jgi:acyl-CoA thioester hydrolase
MERAGIGPHQPLFGLYEGVPLTKRDRGYHLVLPDKITIFQRPMEAVCRTNEEIRNLVRETVMHEIAHHFGIGDERLKELRRMDEGKRVVETEVRARYAETDAQGVVYYANYFVWFEVARMSYLRVIGYDYATLERDGLGFFIAEAGCRYQAPAHFDEELVVRTSVGEVRNRSFVFEYEVYNKESGQLLATGSTVQVFIDERGKPREIPPKLRTVLEEPAL